jgi:hypothetical protein
MRGSSSFPFKKVLGIDYKDSLLNLYEDKDHSPMVLMDGVSGLPIFALSVNPDDHNDDSLSRKGASLMTRRKKDLFQCIFEQDKQPINICVSNLTDRNVAFQIARGNGNGNGNDAINKINMLGSFETSVIKSDYSKGERQMFLDTLEEKVSVAQDEARVDGSAPKGTYLKVQVFPSDPKADWTEAMWTCPDFIIRTVPPPSPSFWGSSSAQPQPAVAFNGRPYSFGGNDTNRPQPQPVATRARPNALTGKSRGRLPNTGMGPFGSNQGGFGGFGAPASPPAYSPQSPSYGTASEPLDSFPNPSFASRGFGGFGAPASPSYDATPDFAVTSTGSSLNDLDELGSSTATHIENSFAANIRHGNVMEQASRSVEMEVFYEKAPVPVTLCLSVMKPGKMTILPPMTESIRLHRMFEVVFDHVSNKNARLLASIKTVHEEKVCCICMDSAPSCIFVKCGHSAVCDACKSKLQEQKCPLCRAFIEASIEK